MTPTQRDKALLRLEVIDAYSSGAISLSAALERTGLSRGRFYSLAAGWREALSLSSLGVLAGSGSTRARLDPDVVNRLQAQVGNVVRLNAGANVSQLVRHLVAASGVADSRLPGIITLRRIVETELRRVAATHEAGHAVQFDCSAINLPQEGGRPHILFVCLDVGTRLILGAAVHRSPDAEAGYRSAARDAQMRIAGSLASAYWSFRLVRAEMTAGKDLDQSVALLERLAAGGVRANLQLAQVPRRYGRYFRKILGARVGRIEITPLRTEDGLAIPDNGDMTPWSDGEATAAVARAADEHNAVVLSTARLEPRGHPPEDLTTLLSLLAVD